MTKPTGKGRGRPKGAVSQAKRELADMAKDHAAAALQTLVDIAARGEAESARVSAANSILDRAYGKPFQAIHHAGNEGQELPSIDAGKLSLNTLRELIEAASNEATEADEG